MSWASLVLGMVGFFGQGLAVLCSGPGEACSWELWQTINPGDLEAAPDVG